MKDHFNFSEDEQAAKTNLLKIKTKIQHLPGCQIKDKIGIKFPLKEIYQNKLDFSNLVILSRKLI